MSARKTPTVPELESAADTIKHNVRNARQERAVLKGKVPATKINRYIRQQHVLLTAVNLALYWHEDNTRNRLPGDQHP